MGEVRRGRVRSRDGTTIAFEARGEGPPLVLVHGALGDHTAWGGVAPLLAPHATVYALDRRGRGESGDTRPYAVEREVEDIAAVLEHLGEPATLFGHSSGALLALLAAQAGPRPRRMVLYEPPVFVAGRARPPVDLADRLEALVHAGERDAAVRIFLREGPGLADYVVERMAASPRWKGSLALAHTVAYDARVADAAPDPAALAALDVPTLLLLGGASPAWMRAGVEHVAAALPDVRLAVLPGQGHDGIHTAPAIVAAEVTAFLGPPA